MFRPLNDRVLVKPDEKETTTESGIILSESTVEKPVTGVVIVGNDQVASGNRIVFSKFGYDEVTVENETHYVVSSFNILGIF